jgi:hypothetical protein
VIVSRVFFTANTRLADEAGSSDANPVSKKEGIRTGILGRTTGGRLKAAVYQSGRSKGEVDIPP